ncbi:unnamed protein product [Chilo suppressalis]|uniref:Doublecortin domain-containing protein n=2 Tax=Chilo suppressalis TaxID=168631 RepID=A0ABN8EBC3_CHISP|nr:unnamed protein product [Chilo suppressalis]
MSLAKVPNSIKTKYEALDIFLFCNGQHTTPPRKYHLKSEELEKWDDTLMRIAQSQYGNKQSIVDLYTMVGEKLTSPIEIANNNVYVAVPHTEKFIPVGYNEYLLKASRSREKRQGKIRISKDVLPETVEQQCNRMSICEDSENKTNNGTDHQAKSPEDNKSILGQTINKKTFHLPFPRKYSRNVPPDTITKVFPKNKEKPQTNKNLKVNMERNLNKDPISITNPNRSIKSKDKDCNKYIFMAKNNKSKRDNIKPEISNQIQKKPTIFDENNISTANPVIDDLTCDKELIVVKKPESMSIDINTGISLLSRPIIPLHEISTLPRLDENVTNTQETFKKNNCYNAENIKVQNVAICNVQSTTHYNVQNEKEISKNTYTNTLEYQYRTDNLNINNDSQPIENFITVVDGGDVINLNLKLKLKKCDGTVKVNIDNKLHSITEKKCNSDVIKEITEDEKTSKLVVLRCSCCCNDDFDVLLQNCDLSSDPTEKIYFVLVPYIDCKNQMIRCNCEQKGTTPSKIEIDETRLSIANPVTKVNADTSLIKRSDKYDMENETQIDIKISDVNIPRTQSLLPNNLKESLNNNSERGNYFSAKDEHLINTNLNSVQVNTTEPNEDLESLILRINDSNMTKQFMDNTTQTEWSSLLLEAKRHEDGNYSFHLPPLSVLKYYF